MNTKETPGLKIWVDDLQPAPEGYFWIKNVYKAITLIKNATKHGRKIDILDLDHDAGEQAGFGGDYIKILDWMEQTGHTCPIRLHSTNSVGVQNMRAIIKKNGWEEIK